MEVLKKINTILFFVFAVFLIFYYGASFIIPFTFGIFLAILMTPFCNFLESIKFKRIFAALTSTIVVFVLVGGMLFLFSSQMTQFLKDLSQLEENLRKFFENFQEAISSITGLSHEDQDNFLQKRSDDLLSTIESKLTSFLGNVLSITLKFFLVLIYIFLFLLYRNKFSTFAMLYVKEEKEEEVKKFLYKISRVVFQYLWGRCQVMLILGTMYIITFLLFDIRYAILLTVFGSLVTIIPYIGPFVSGVLPVLFSILYGKSLNEILLFALIILIIQLIESYVLEPVIIGKEVKLNPLVVIVAVILGGMVWGIAGMILFVPIFAVIRIIANYSEGMKPVDFLLGNAKKPK